MITTRIVHTLVLGGMLVSGYIDSAEARFRPRGGSAALAQGPNWFLLIVGIIAFIGSAYMFKEFVLDAEEEENPSEDDLPKGFWVVVLLFGMFCGIYMTYKAATGAW